MFRSKTHLQRTTPLLLPSIRIICRSEARTNVLTSEATTGSVGERRRECSAVGDAVVRLLDSPAYAHFRKVLIGFSQGGYLSYRMVAEHPDVFDMAILMSPSFKGETAEPLPATGRTRFALCYGSEDRAIPLSDQQCARNKLTQTGNLTYFEYPGMSHGICDQEIRDLRAWLGL